MPNVRYSTGQDIREIHSGAHQVIYFVRKDRISALTIFLSRVKKALALIFAFAILGYAMIQPWAGSKILSYLRAVGLIQ
jgi:hypothetical protein